jgi:hypothetical protein
LGNLQVILLKYMRKYSPIVLLLLLLLLMSHVRWGFYAHQRINRQAVFTLPSEMAPFFKKNIRHIMDYAVQPDQRRYAVADEAPKHFIDLDVYGDSAAHKLPRHWQAALQAIGADSLQRHGIVPWHIQHMKHNLTEAFRTKNAHQIIKLSAEIGHYIADAHVPLHTTRNYNGQLSGQEGIHAFWESRLPELFAHEYDFFVGPARYLPSTQASAWQAIIQANAALDSVLIFEKKLDAQTKPSHKYTVEQRNATNIKTYSRQYSRRYHTLLANQVERQMKASILLIGSFWYTCWVDAGQPDLSQLMSYQKTEQQIKEEETEQKTWQQKQIKARDEG